MKKRLSNISEQIVHDQIIGTVANYKAHIYRKPRVADVINIRDLNQASLRTYALQSHFDFCVCDENHDPLFVIEFDGPGHDPKNDHKKNKIAQDSDLALFRIDWNLLSRTQGCMTFLQYLIHVWFLGLEFKKMQESGRFGPEEPFMMSSFLRPDARNVFDSEFNFRGFAVSRFVKTIIKQGKTPKPLQHMDLSTVVFGRDDSSFITFAGAIVEEKTVYGRGRIDIGTPHLGELDQLPFGWSALSDFCEGLCIDDLSDNVDLTFTNGAHTVLNFEQVKSEAQSLKSAGYRSLRAFYGNDTLASI